MSKATPVGVPVIVIALIAFFLLYTILVPPSERVKMFNSDKPIESNTIQIKDKMFIPGELNVQKGSSVTWVNEDNEDNKISGSNFESGILHNGESYTHTFDETGIYVYASEFYPGVTGKIIVK